ncbi:Hypothetical protein CAP_3919 [Chondromyces apiculatus DSM 436]|uniref:MalT-like TPR region domain-containing protein n=2 Tax=Chondromyces apiculatus TaxID=51 RepID=A0A017THS4_9BACT|nr:Hypothetical protein CAP_3919 [Chondromyces apiculatus DSM 436]
MAAEAKRLASSVQYMGGVAMALHLEGSLALQRDEHDATRGYDDLALAIFRTVHDRLGEANCLRSLGDLGRHVDDLDAARQHYNLALVIYRDIQHRLGEANCLQGLGLLSLALQRPSEAFARFQEVLRGFRDIRDLRGQEAVHGYMARAALAAGAGDQALVLAEASLEIGRTISDAVSAKRLVLRLARERSSMDPEAWRALQEQAEDSRKAAIDAARERLRAADRDVYDLPSPLP